MANLPDSRSGLNPYISFPFRLKWGERYVAGFSKASALGLESEPVDHRDAGDQRPNAKAPIHTTHGAMTLERGVSLDTEFQRWASSRPDLEDAPKEIMLEVYDEMGQLTLVYRLHRCWVSEILALPDLNVHTEAVAIERIRLENEGWEWQKT